MGTTLLYCISGLKYTHLESLLGTGIVAVSGGLMPGTVTICGANILAAGHLVYIILVNSTSMVVAFSALDRSREATTIHGLRADIYTVLVFDIESNNLTAVDSKNISVLVGSESDESQPTGMLLIVYIHIQG